MICFNKPPCVPQSLVYLQQAAESGAIQGDGPFTRACNQWIEEQFGVQKALLTTSGTAALEMAAHLCHIKPGDEVILPSYTFSSTATAFVNVGAKLVFVDVRPDTMNMDETKLEAAITERTRVLVPVHYAGVACEMDAIMDIARRHDLLVVEDAAQGVMSTYKGRALGSIGDIGCFSFHATKNYAMGEGGACLLRDSHMNEEAEILREKGTNRSKFFRGQVDKYTWVGFGSSYLPSDINAAYLLGQLESAQQINDSRRKLWATYFEALEPLALQGHFELPVIPEDCVHNAHLFFIKCRDLVQRTELIEYLAQRDIAAVFHYVPLHSSPAGKQYGRFSGEDCFTTTHSDRLVRLPLYYDLSLADQKAVIETVRAFFEAGMN